MTKKEAVQEIIRASKDIDGKACVSSLIAIGMIEKIDRLDEEKERDIEELEAF